MKTYLVRLLALFLSVLVPFSIANMTFLIRPTEFGVAVKYVLYAMMMSTFLFLFVFLPVLKIQNFLVIKYHLSSSTFRKDSICVLVFLAICALWLYLPRNPNFSFADGVGEIVRKGEITPYGYFKHTKSFLYCLFAGVIYLATLKLLAINSSVLDQKK